MLLSFTEVKQGDALMGHNSAGPPSRAAPGELRRIFECYRRRQTTTTGAREQNNTGSLTLCVGRPVIT